MSIEQARRALEASAAIIKLENKLGWQVFIRWALTAALIFGAYTETGGYTATALTLIFIAVEIITWRKYE